MDRVFFFKTGASFTSSLNWSVKVVFLKEKENSWSSLREITFLCFTNFFFIFWMFLQNFVNIFILLDLLIMYSLELLYYFRCQNQNHRFKPKDKSKNCMKFKCVHVSECRQFNWQAPTLNHTKKDQVKRKIRGFGPDD